MKTPHFVFENGRSMVRGGSSSSRFSCGQVKLFRHIGTYQRLYGSLLLAKKVLGKQ
jgi:hypothetical protein